jgi:hypothetical protein
MVPPPNRVESARNLEMAVARVWSVNSARLTRRKQLDGDGLCHIHGTFIPDKVHVAPTGIDKPHPHCVGVRSTVRIIPFIGGHRSRGDDN